MSSVINKIHAIFTKEMISLHIRNTGIKKVCILVLIPIVLVSGLFGYTIGVLFEKEKYRDFLKGFKILQENSDKYDYINPLIGNISAAATDVDIYTDIKDDIVSYLQTEKDKGELSSYSFYFRDLNSGLWFGSNEKESFFPASLFKLPIAIAVYKEAEDDPTFLTKNIIYSDAMSKANEYTQLNSVSSLKVGQTYSVQDLVEIMIVMSDNGAKDMLLNTLDQHYLNRLFELVSLADPNQMKTFNISARKYALFLRVLYGSSYLNNEHSELLMKMLTKSDFKDGLIAGVPYTTKIAHKFGTYEIEETNNGVIQTFNLLHDCGVVYHPQRPYLICVMTKGNKIENLYSIISHLSQMVYTYQDNEHD